MSGSLQKGTHYHKIDEQMSVSVFKKKKKEDHHYKDGPLFYMFTRLY